MTDQPGAIDLSARQSFAFFTPVPIRFCDTDKMGHVNNCAITTFIESGRCDFVYGLIKAAGAAAEHVDFILARLAVDFRRELHYPGTVEVGTRLTRLGGKSVSSGYGVFIGDTCYATAECVNVFYDPVGRRSMEPPPALRSLLERERATPGAVVRS
ncbi:MAG TPA: thioesterase family protein [Hyphomicrobiaceae bacterium]|nr:thioesterase family protein [Hyphomicrobiaceae bacterium]